MEQKRIVARIEELFSQLDASVAELKTAKERLKVYRQAVLKEAFGEVTTHTPFGEIIDARLWKMLDKEKIPEIFINICVISTSGGFLSICLIC